MGLLFFGEEKCAQAARERMDTKDYDGEEFKECVAEELSTTIVSSRKELRRAPRASKLLMTTLNGYKVLVKILEKR